MLLIALYSGGSHNSESVLKHGYKNRKKELYMYICVTKNCAKKWTNPDLDDIDY